jgi:hypothetical protein
MLVTGSNPAAHQELSEKPTNFRSLPFLFPGALCPPPLLPSYLTIPSHFVDRHRRSFKKNVFFVATFPTGMLG